MASFPVLVVDDDITMRTMVVLQLNQLGYTADSAANGVEAVRRVHEHQYCLILMDIQMPHMDGFEAAAAIRAHEKKQGSKRVPIVAISGSGTAAKGLCLEAGMDDYHPKPAGLEDIRRITDKWCCREIESA